MVSSIKLWREFVTSLISKIPVFEERQLNEQWLDNDDRLEVGCLLEQQKRAKDFAQIGIDAEEYYRIKASEKEADKE